MNVHRIRILLIILLQPVLCRGMSDGWTEVKAKHHDKKQQSNESKFILACKCNNGDLVNQLIGHVSVDATDDKGDSALSVAACFNRVSIANQLLEHKANLNHRNKKGQTPLMGASYFGHLAMIDFLVRSGAILEECDDEGSTALMHAASGGHPQAVQLLIDNKAKVNVKNVAKGRTALHWAIRMCRGSECKQAKQHDAKDVLSIVQILLAANADPKIKDNEGMSPIDWADEYKLSLIAKVLRKAVANNPGRAK